MRFLRTIFLYFSLLTALHGFGQTATFTSSPAANNNVLSLCAGSQVLFTNTSAGVSSINWNFQGGNPASSNTLGPHIVTFANPGTYTVSLSVNNGPATTMQVVIQASNPSPNLNILLDISCGSGFGTSTFNNVTYFTSCANPFMGDQLCLYSNTTSTNQNSIHTVNWGDGMSNTYTGSNILVGDFNFQHGYASSGTSYITYSVQQNNNSCIKSQILMLYTGANPTATISPGGIPTLCNPGSVVYNINPGGQNTPGTIYTIAVNDGGSYTYNHPPPAAVTHNFNSVSCGTTSVINGVNYPNSFQASITCSNACGSSSSAIGPINIQSPPDAQMTTTPSLSPYNNNVCQGSNVTFNDVSIPGTNINIQGNANANPPIPPYSCNNVYKRIWKIYGPSGPIYASNANVTITGSIGSGILPNVNLLAPGGWNNGAPSINLTFLQPGNYKVTLYVGGLSYNPCGVDSAVTNICVTPDFQVNITSPFVTACAPATGVFQNSSTLAQCNLTNVSAWSVTTSNPNQCGQPAWSYSNNTNAQSLNPSITFTGPGVYTIQLINSLSSPVFSNTAPLGCQAKTDTAIITIKSPPLITINAPNSICLGSTFNPTATINNCYSNQNPTYAWDFNPNATPLLPANVPTPDTSNALNPGAILYPNAGTFPYLITATNECGPTTVTQNIAVQNPVTVSPGLYGPFCMNSPVALSGSVTGGVANGYWTANVPGGSFSAIGVGGAASGALNSTYTPPNNYIGNIILTLTSTQPPAPCPVVSGQTTLVFNQLATANASTYPNGLCAGQSLNLNGSIGGAASSATWSSNVGGTFANPASLTTTWTPPAGYTGTAVLTLTTNDPAGPCNPATSTATVLVKPLPVATSPATVGPICSGGNAVITVTSSINPSTFVWNASVPAGVVATASGSLNSGSNTATLTTPISNNTNAPQTVVYIFTPTANGCSGIPDTTSIIIQPVATVGPYSPITVCPGSTISPSAFVSNPIGATFAWSNTNIQLGIAGSGNGQLAPWTAPSNTNNNTPGTIVGTITVTPTFNNCPGTPSTFLVTVNPTPTITNASLTQAICSGSNTTAVTWTPSPVGTTFAWTGAASTPNITGFTAAGSGNLPVMTISNSGNTPGTVTYTVTPSRNGCAGPAITYTITVNPTPVLTLSANQTICGGQTTLASTYTNSVAGGIFTYALQNAAGVPAAVTGFPTTGNGQIPAATINNSGATPFTLNYTITPSANGCNGTVGTYAITVNPAPVTTFSLANQSICTGQNTASVTLNSSTAGVSFSWNVQGVIPAGLTNFTPTVGTNTIPAYNNLVNSTASPITVTITAQATTSGPAQCPGANANYTITIKPSPIASATWVSNDTICSGSSIQINLSSTTLGTTFTWTATNGVGAAGAQNSANPTSVINQVLTNNSSAIANATYTVTPTAAACVGSPINVMAFINPVASVGPFNPIVTCPGSTISPSAFVSNPVGATFTWTNTNTSIGIGVSGSGQIASWTAPSNTNNNTPGTIVGTITVLPTFNNCPGTPSTFSVTVNPTPTITNASLTQAICSGSNTTAVTWTPSPVGTTFAWTGAASTPNITGFTAAGSGNLPVMTISNSGNTPGTVTYTVTPSRNGCAGPAITYTITVNPTPVLTLSANQTICGGQTTLASTYTNSVAGGIFTYALQNAAGVPAAVTGFPTTGNGQIPAATINNSGATPFTLNYTITPSANGCNGTVGTYAITVNPAPVTTFSLANQSICTGQNTALVNLSSTTPGATFSWNLQGAVPPGLLNLNPTSGTSSIPVFSNLINNTTAPISLIFQAQATTSGPAQCPGANANYTITVNPSPIAASSFISNDTICSGQNINIALSSTTAGTTYTWTVSNGAGVSGGQNSAAPSSTINQALTNNSTSVGSVTYIVTPSASSCAGSPLQVLAYVNPVALVGPFNPIVVCPGVTIIPPTFVSNPNGATYGWSNTNAQIGIAASGNGQIASWTAPSNTNNNSPGTIVGTITVTPTFNACPGTPASFVVTINPTPTITNSPLTQTICSGANSTLVSWTPNAAGTSYAWTGVASSGTVTGYSATGNGNLPAMAIINGSISVQTVTYTVTPTRNGCSGPSVSYTININPTPVLTLSANQTICGGQTTVASAYTNSVAGGIFTYALQNAVGVPVAVTGFPTTGNGQIPAATINNSGTTPYTLNYTVTPTANGCNGAVGTYSITINPAPVTTFSIANQAICSGTNTAPVTFSSTTPNVTYAWQATVPNGISNLAPTSGSGNLPSFTNVTNANNAVQTVQFSVTASTAGTVCAGQPATYSIAVIPIPTVNALSNATYCNGVAIPALPITSNVPAATYAWSMSTNVGLTPTSGTGTPIPGFNASIAGTVPINSTVTVTPSASSGATTCPGSPVTYTLTINPVPTVTPIGNQVLCAGNTNNATTVLSSVAGTSFAWTNNNTNTGLAASGSNTVPSFVGTNNTNLPILSTVSVVPSFTNNQVVCTGATSNYTITVNPLPTIAPTQNQQVCAGNQVAVTFSSPNNIAGTVYNWTNSNAAIGLNGTGSGNISFTGVNNTNGPISGLIVATPSFSNGGIACPGVPDTFLVTILPTPVATALTNQTICAGAPSAAINFTSNQVGTVFTWTSTNQVIGIASSGTGNIAPFTAVNAGTAPISSTVIATPTLTTNGQGCAGATVSALITVNPNPVMTSPASASFCQGTTVAYNFTNNIPNGVVYAWNNSNTAIGLGASGNGNISFQAQNGTSAPISGTVSVIPTYTSNGVSCAGITQTFNIQIIPTPTVNAVNNITLCNGAASNVVNLTSPVANASFAWTNANTAIGLGASGSGNVPIFTATNPSTTTPLSSQVSVSSSVLVNGVTCTGNPTLFTITVNPSTVPTAVNGQTLCNGSNSAAIALSGTGNSYDWTNSNTAVGLAASGSGNIASFIATNGTAAPISSTVTVTSVFSGGGVSCNGGTTTFIINVNPTPSVTAPANVVLCNNATASAISFIGTGTQYNWTNSTPGIGLAASGSGNIPSFIAVNLTATPIVATINVTPIYVNNAVSCPGTVQSFTITVNPAPQVNFSVPSQTICSGTSSALVTVSSPTPNAVITWTATTVPASISGVNTASGGSTIPSFTLINNSVTVQVIQFSANAATGGALACPGGGVSYTITVNPSPNVAAPTNQVVCANTSTNAVTFSGNANVYNWSNNTTSIGLGASGQGNILAFNALNNTSNPVTATVTVTPQFLNNNVACNGIPVTFTYTVNPIPVTNPISNQTICNGTNSSLVTPGGTATSYAWTNNNQNTGLAASGSNTIPVFQGTNVGAAPITSVITLTPTYSNLNISCAGSTSTFNITVNPTPTVTALANQVVCNNTSTAASIFSGTGTSYTWTNTNNAIGLATSGTGTIAAFNAVNASNSIPSVATVTVTPVFTNNSVSCQGIPTSFTYTINPTPVVTAPANQVICNGASSTQVTFNGTGTQYNWTNTLTSIGLAASGSGNINAFTVSNGTINPVVSQVSVVPVFSGNNLNCAGTPQTFSITVNPSPSAVLPANQIICNGQATAAINFTGTATSYSWTNDLTSMGLAASGNGNIGSFNAVNNTNAPVTATLVVQPIFTGANLNCPGVSQTFTITVNPTPTMGVLTNQVLCNGTSSAAINFTGTATSYAWTNNTPTIGLAASGTGNIGAFSVVNASNSAAVTATLSVTPQFANGGLTCSGAVQQVTIIVNPTPIITPNPDLTYCNGASTPVISFAGTGNSYTWVNNQNSIGLAASGNGNIASFNVSNPTSSSVIATVDVTPVFTANGISCNGTVDQFTITVNPTPTLAALANQVVCNGSPTTAVSFTGTVAGTVFNWTNNATSIGLVASGSGNIASFNAVNNGNNPIVAQVNVTPSYALNGVSCSGTAQSFTITVNPTPAVNFSLANQTICSQGASNTVNITSPTNGAVITWSATTIPASITGLNPTTGNATIPSLTLTNNSSVPQIIQILASATTPGNVACPGGGTPYTITVNPTPAVTAPANQVVCHNTNTSAVSFSGTGTSYTWTNNQTSVGLAASGTGNIVAFNAVNPSNSVISTATVSVTPQFTNNNVTCPGPVQTFTITVNPIPVVTPMANATFCNGTNTSLIAINGTGTSYAWTNSTTSIGLGASGSGNIAPFAASNVGSTPVNATIGIIPSFTNAGVTCAGLNSNATITINPTPTVNNVNSQVICNNTSTAAITLSGTGNSYTWANNTQSIGLANAGTGNIASFVGLNASNAAASIATLTVTPQYLNNGVNCSGNTANFTITVNPTPSANVPSSQTLCNGATTAQVNFSGTGTSYNWTNSIATIGIPASGSGNITPFVAVNNGLNPVTAQLVVTPIFTGNGVSCSGTAQNFSITINPTPVVQVPANQVICNGNLSNAVNFSGNGTSYAWTNSNPSVGLAASGTGNISSFTTTNATTNPVTSTITVSPSFAGGNASCPGLPQSFTITVNPTPAVDPINSQVLCSGTPTQAIALTGTGTSYAWANNTLGIGLAASGSGNIASFNATNASSSNPLVGTITVTPQYANAGVSCSGNTQQFTITVNPTPVVNPLSNVTVCNGSNTPVVSFAGTGTSYNWSNNNNTIGLVPSGTGLSLASFQAINQSTQSVNALITVTPNFTANGVTCPGNNTTFTIFVSPTPDVVAPANQVVCNGSPTNAVTFNGSVANTTYNWSNSIPSIGILGTGTGNIAAFNAVNNGNAAIFAQVTITPTFIQNAVSCPGSPQSYTYQINPTPSVTNPGSQYVCAGANTQLLNFTGTGTSYQWAAANTAIGIGANGTNSIPAFIGQNATNAVSSSQVTVTPIFTQGISCSGSNQTFTYYVLPIPSVAPINNQSYCHQTAVNATAINGSGTSYNWTNSNTAIGLVATGSNTVNAFNATNPGTSAISGNVNITPIFTFQGQSCNGPVGTYSITVNPTPYVNALNDTVICNNQNAAVNITTNIPANITWFATQNANVSGELTTVQTNTFINDLLSNTSSVPQSVTYTITPTTLAGCVGPDSFVVVQVQPDVLLNIPQNLEICSGAGVNAVLAANIPSNFSWFCTVNNPNVTGESLITNSGAVINDVLVNNSNQNQLVVYSVTPTSIQGNCQGPSQTITVIVKPPLALLNQDTVTICSNGNVNLNLVANTNVTFNWYADPNVNVLNETTNITTSSIINDQLVNPTGAVEEVTYHVIGTSVANGCSSPVIPITVFVNPIPSVNPNPDLNLCHNQWTPQVVFTGNAPGAVYNWSAAGAAVGLQSLGGIDSLNAFVASNPGVAPISAIIIVSPLFTANNVSCAGAKDTFQIVVNPQPSAFPLNNLILCEGTNSAVVPILGPIGGTTFNWVNSNAAVGLASTGTGNVPVFMAQNPTALPIQSVVTVTPIFINGNAQCPGQTISFTVTVNPAPTVDTVNLAICADNNVAHALSADLPSSFTWFATPNPLVINETSNPIQSSSTINDNLIQITNAPQTVQYNVTATTIAHGCTGSGVVNVVVNPWPTVAFNTINPPYCDLSPIAFQNMSVGAYDYLWHFGDGTNSYLSNPSHQFPAVGTYNVTLVATDPYTGCSDSTMQPVSISPSPNPGFSYSDSIGCGLLDVVFTADVYNPSWNYQWTFGNGATTQQLGQVGYQYATNGCYDVSLSVTNPQGCTTTETYFDVMCVYDSPVAVAGADPTEVTTLEPLVEFTNNSENASSYAWNFGDGTYGFGFEPIHLFPAEPADYVVSLVAMNEAGCTDTAYVSIHVEENLIYYVPNSFTPNDDEKNQVFLPIISQGFKPGTYLLRIFNRWGELVFESKDPYTGWGGDYGPNHTNCQSGTYTWVLNFQVLQSQEDKEFVGHVNLIK
jgi:gliding motility-associated-like protein